jgi:acyl carrier protein
LVDNLVKLQLLADEEALTGFLRAEISKRLYVEPSQLGPRDNLVELGLDSLKAVELKIALESELGFGLSTSLVFDYPTVESLVGFLLAKMGGLRVSSAIDESLGFGVSGQAMSPSDVPGELPQARLAELLATELHELRLLDQGDQTTAPED